MLRKTFLEASRLEVENAHRLVQEQELRISWLEDAAMDTREAESLLRILRQSLKLLRQSLTLQEKAMREPSQPRIVRQARSQAEE